MIYFTLIVFDVYFDQKGINLYRWREYEKI